MKLPISREDAIKEWHRFEDYLVRERYAVRDPDTGKPVEKTLADVLKRVSNQYAIHHRHPLSDEWRQSLYPAQGLLFLLSPG